MTDQPATYNGLTLDELLAGRKVLQQAKMTGTLSVQFPDGTRVQYRIMAELDAALRDTNYGISLLQPAAVVDPMQQPVRTWIARPWSGYR